MTSLSARAKTGGNLPPVSKTPFGKISLTAFFPVPVNFRKCFGLINFKR